MAKGTKQWKHSKEAAKADWNGGYDSSSNNDHEADEDHDNEEYVDEESADEEFSGAESDAALSARKEAFYKEVEKKIVALSKVKKNAHIISDGLFNKVYNFMLSIQDTSDEERLRILRSIPNKVGFRRMKMFDICTVDTSNVLIFKQAEDEALDACQKVVKYSKIFDVVQNIHELEEGSDHCKAIQEGIDKIWKEHPSSGVSYFLCVVLCVFGPSLKRRQSQVINLC
jgi:hypothetical protein